MKSTTYIGKVLVYLCRLAFVKQVADILVRLSGFPSAKEGKNVRLLTDAQFYFLVRFLNISWLLFS